MIKKLICQVPAEAEITGYLVCNYKESGSAEQLEQDMGTVLSGDM